MLLNSRRLPVEVVCRHLCLQWYQRHDRRPEFTIVEELQDGRDEGIVRWLGQISRAVSNLAAERGSFSKPAGQCDGRRKPRTVMGPHDRAEPARQYR